MTATLLERSVPARRTWAEFISEATEAAGDARARAHVARLLRLPAEALAYDLAAHRHEAAATAVRSLLATQRT